LSVEEEPLPPFTGVKSVCLKCNATGAISTWRPQVLPEMPFVCWDETELGMIDMERREHIHRECHRCGYGWNEDIYRLPVPEGAPYPGEPPCEPEDVHLGEPE
jgi:hypothetical protein